MSPPEFPDDFAFRATSDGADVLVDIFTWHRAWLAQMLARGIPFHLHDQVDNLVQEVAVKVVQGQDHFQWRGPEACRAWLLRIARQRLADWWRAYRGTETAAGTCPPHEDHAEALWEQVPTAEASPSQVLRQQERAQLLAEVLNQLEPNERELLQLRHDQGLSWAEVAERTGRTEGAVKMAWKRLLNWLRAQLHASDFWSSH